MKTKTATIRIYKMWGTDTLSADVMYRGKMIVCFDGRDLFALQGMARMAARNRGFTHFKIVN